MGRSWETLPTSAPRARYEQGYVQVGDRFYLFGGRGIKPVDIFVPATGKWTSGSPPPLEIHHFQVRVIDGKMYAAGGRRSAAASGQPFELTVAEVDVYDFATDTWT